ncbi:type II secretion system F family protein [Patescibacteria group bacterium]|nr:type II secretion system F family protein [Patescibacteria group bacterium]MBU1721177.1 type II secretion system F family protein [Patescibacteria group bacterium]MBU1900893.1 type II secretion system F family protein [Patescibacteria group bacterium]
MPVKKKKKISVLKKNIAIGGTGLTQKALLAKHLAVMQRSGLSIVESLDIVADSAQGKMKNILIKIRESVESGNSLSDAFQRYDNIFPGIFISAIYAGEKSGTLDENLEHLAEQLQKEKNLVSKVKGAMLYPIVVLIASFILAMTMSFLVLPKIIPLFQGLKTELPLSTRLLIQFSQIVNDHGPLLFFSITGTVLFVIWLFRRKFMRPISHWLLLHLPVLSSISHNVNLARFSRTLSTLLRSGLNVDEALAVTRQSLGNYYYQHALDKVLHRLEKGSSMAENLGLYPRLFPSMVTRMVLVGEESGNLEDTLNYLAEFYEVEVDNATKSLATAIEPILLLGIGMIVAFLAISIITPIYNITGSIKR